MVRGPAFWDRVITAIDAGGTQAEVAARFGVSTAAIRYWLTRRRRAQQAELLPVRVTGSNGGVRLELEVGGVIIRLVDGADPAFVAELVRALRSC
jgi:hypothetical protein